MALIYLSLFLTVVFCQTRTGWQYLIGPITPNPNTNTPSLDPATQEAALDATAIPPADDANWANCVTGDTYCPSAASLNVGMADPHGHTSRLPTGNCWVDFAYSFYQTYITVPADVTVTNFQINFPDNVIDDGALVVITNSKYPSGKKITYVGFTSSATADLSSFVAAGSNRLVISQIDSCCCQNRIVAQIQLNGAPVNPTCEDQPSRPCDKFQWDGTDCSPVAQPVGTTCDDGNACTKDDKCAAGGVCQGTAVTCAARTCYTGACNAASGNCDYTVDASQKGQKCDDKNGCSINDVCGTNGCQGTSSNLCTICSSLSHSVLAPGQVLTIVGKGFLAINPNLLKCSFRWSVDSGDCPAPTITTATFVSDTAVTCVVPAIPAGVSLNVGVAVSIDGGLNFCNELALVLELLCSCKVEFVANLLFSLTNFLVNLIGICPPGVTITPCPGTSLGLLGGPQCLLVTGTGTAVGLVNGVVNTLVGLLSGVLGIVSGTIAVTVLTVCSVL